MAPWTKASSSRPGSVFSRMPRISERGTSRASTTRLAPSSQQTWAAAKFTMPVWVEMCRSTWGATFPAKASTPKSEMIKASTPMSWQAVRKPGSSSNSWLRGRVLQVT